MIYIGLFLLSLVLTYTVKLLAYRHAIMDTPNERSSHTIPTPRGGGIAILIVFYMGLIYFINDIDSRLFYALLCSLPIALIGFIDDLISLSSKIRLFVQGLAALCALYFLDGVNSIDFLLFEANGSWLNSIAFLTIIWLTNLYNFLDGIDGYAGSEAVIAGLGLYVFFHNPLGLVIIAASLGFLYYNWHKASIFMGDVGSATLGFIFAIFVFYDTSQGNIYIWLVLLSMFWFDATMTLMRRLKSGENITQAHKKHAYQRLVQYGWSHDKVVGASLAFNFIFLMLLYFVDNVLIVFVVNMVFLYIIVKLIDSKKSFV